MKYQEKRKLLLKVLGYWEAALKCLPHFIFMELESINFTLEKLSRTLFGIMKWAYLWGPSMLTCQNRDVFISGGIFWFLCCTFFILHYFHVAHCATCCYSTLFLLHFALHPFYAHFLRVRLFSYCTFFMFNNFHVAFFSFTFFSCCTLSMLHFFPAVLFSLFLLDHNIDLRKHPEVKIFWKIITFSIIKSSRPGDVPQKRCF